MNTEKIIYLLKRTLFRLSPGLAEKLNINFELKAKNRDFLEKQTFGLLNILTHNRNHSRCLFLGLDKHNWHYPRLLDCEFHSIDLNPSNAIYGRPGRHITGSVLHLSDHYPANHFPIVVANGLIGFGINNKDDFHVMMQKIKIIMQDGGLLILGYNNRPDRLSFDIDEAIQSLDMLPVTPSIPGITSHVHEVSDGFMHRYVFLLKPPITESAGWPHWLQPTPSTPSP